MQVRIPDTNDIIGKLAKEANTELPDLSRWSEIQPGKFFAHRDEMPGIIQEMLKAG